VVGWWWMSSWARATRSAPRAGLGKAGLLAVPRRLLSRSEYGWTSSIV